MSNKDKTEKLFVACRDVFAELINILLYQGEHVLTEERMLPGPTESIYPGHKEKLASQFQDYSMYEISQGEVCALYTLENQSGIDRQMFLRHIGYEGASYRRQYGRKKTEGVYPVISMVLNWGEKRWTAATTIRELMNHPIHRLAEDYVNRSRMQVFDMRFLDSAVRERFEGDMRVVLDYLSDRESLLRRQQELKNPEEVMRMLHALSGDIRYLENITRMKEGGSTVCDLLDEMVNKGIEQGMERGRQQGFAEGLQEGLKALISTCKELKLSFDETTVKVQEKFSLGDEETGVSMRLYW